MNKEQAEGLMVALGTKATSLSHPWVRGPCALAPWLHKKGKDSHPSFGLNIAQGTAGRFHCFSCESGSLDKLIQLIEFHALKDPGRFKGNLPKAREIIEQEEIDLPVLPAYSEFGISDVKKFQPLPEYWLESWLPVAQYQRAMTYLIDVRGFTLSEAVKYDLRYDSKDDRIIFPYRDVFGRLAGLRGRGVQMPGEYHPTAHHDYVWDDINNAALTWYNEQILDEPGPVVVVEGQFDALRTARAYPRVLANLTAKPMIEKMKKLAQCEGVVVMLDGDATGRIGTQKFVDFLNVLKVPTAVVLLPVEDDQGNEVKTDPDKLGEEWIHEELKKIGLVS